MKSKEIAWVTCPCCNGAKRLLIFEPADDDHDHASLFATDPAHAATGMIIAERVICCHCQGKGEVPAEPDD